MPTFGTGQTIGSNYGNVDTSPAANVGEKQGTSTGDYRYAKAGAALAAGDLCVFSTDGAWTATKYATAANVVPLGVPQVAIPSGSYGWFFVGGGQFNVNTAAGVASGAKLTATATPGQAGAGGATIGATAAAASGAGGVTAAFAPAALVSSAYA